MYLYCAMADAAELTGDAGLTKSDGRIWHDVAERKMYLTGGIGPSAATKASPSPTICPTTRPTAETCAAIGMAPVEPSPVPDERRRQIRRRGGARGL